MGERRQNRLRAVAVALAPAVLLAGAFVHPYIGTIPASGDLADIATSQPTRWAIAHLVLGIGIALMLLAIFAIRTYLHDSGEDRWSFWSTALVTIGLALIGFMVGAEGFGGRAAVEAGAAEAFFEGLEPWALPTYVGANLLAAAGLIGLATGIAKSAILGKPGAWLVAAGAVVATVGLFTPFGFSAHVVSVGAMLFAWPVAVSLWSAEGGVEQPS